MAEAVLKTKLANFLSDNGMWVGGKVTVTPTAVHMNANAMNRLAQGGTMDYEIPMSAIHKVYVEWGFVTKIVCMDTDAGTYQFRCFGAKGIASIIGKTYLALALKRTR